MVDINTTVSYQTVKYQGQDSMYLMNKGNFKIVSETGIVSVRGATHLATGSIKQTSVLESCINPATLCTAILQSVGFAVQFSIGE